MILDRYSEDLFFLEDFECLQINQEHFVKIGALLKQVVVDEMVNMGNISLQQQTGSYFVCTGAYDPKSRQTFTFSGEYPKCNSKAVTYGKDELRARKPERQRGKLDLMSIYDRRNHEERTELTIEEGSSP